MTKLTKVEELKTKRFVIRKSLIGKNVVISFPKTSIQNENLHCVFTKLYYIFNTTILIQCKYDTYWIIYMNKQTCS